MEEKKESKINKNQNLTLINRETLTITGVEKIISIKTELIQLNSNFGGIIISGNNLELLSLDHENTIATIKGNISSIKYLPIKEKESLFRKIFK